MGDTRTNVLLTGYSYDRPYRVVVEVTSDEGGMWTVRLPANLPIAARVHATTVLETLGHRVTNAH